VPTFIPPSIQLKQADIQGKRIGKVVGELMENEALMERYEQLSTGLLDWIKQKIGELNDRQFVNSLKGVQQQLASFNAYRVVVYASTFLL